MDWGIFFEGLLNPTLYWVLAAALYGLSLHRRIIKIRKQNDTMIKLLRKIAENTGHHINLFSGHDKGL